MASPPLLVVGSAFRADVAFNRPANATPYAVGRVVGGVGAAGAVHELVSTDIPAGAHLLINNCQVRMSGTALPVNMNGGFELHLFSSRPADAADAAVFTNAPAEQGIYIDQIDIQALRLIGGGFLSRSERFVGAQVKLPAGIDRFFGELVTAPGNLMTPTSSALIQIILRGVVLGMGVG